MDNLSTIGGATLWIGVVFALMTTALTPVSIASPAIERAAEAAQVETGAPASS